MSLPPPVLSMLLLLVLCGCKLAAVGEELIADARHSHPGASIPPQVRMDAPIPDVTAPHPRLFFADAEIPAIKQAIHDDPQLRAKYDELRRMAERLLNDPPAEYVRDTEKSLTVSRLVLSRVSMLAGLYRLSGDTRFAVRAKQEMLAAAAFHDWHPIDFLPTAEMLNAQAIGYDWLFGYLTADERATIKAAMLEKGLLPAQHAYKFQEDWTYTNSNHNPVGNGGVAVACIALADEEPKLAKQLIADTRRSLPPAMSQYAPDGAWPEGPIYWDYATRYATFYLNALSAGLGTDFGAGSYRGFAETGIFRIYSIGPLKKAFNFGDAEEQVHPAPFMYELARRFHQPLYAAHEKEMSPDDVNMFEIIWRARLGSIGAFEPMAEQSLPLDRMFRGVDVAFLRGSWSDPDTTWVGFKAGTNKGPHRHLDLGSFVVDALGQRWALDLGADDYGLPGYNGTDKRWSYYRCSTEGHNALTMDGGNQSADGDSSMAGFFSAPERSYAVVDMTAAYPHARRVLRGIEMLHRTDVIVVDEVEMDGPTRITWNFHTKAHIKASGASARLEMNGRILDAQILAPAGAKFEVISANPPPPQAQQPDVHNLIVHLPEPVAHTRIIVLLSPLAVAGGEPMARAQQPPAKIQPLSHWIADSPVKNDH
jgi:hypothetical protein